MKKLYTLIIAATVAATASAQGVLPTVEQPLAQITQNPGLTGIIHSWGFVGDSLSSGELESRDDNGKIGFNDFYEYSWGQRLCQATGAKGDNYSQGGETAKGWIANFWDNPANKNNNIDAKLSPKQAYIIALGVNDFWTHAALGDSTDINLSDYTKNADTFIGNYAGIIQRLKTLEPRAKFFVVTIPRNGTKTYEFNDAIRLMAKVFDNTYVIDLEKYGPSYEPGSEIEQNYYVGTHLSAAGYQLTAWIMMNYIDWIIRHNMEDFKQVGFIGTDLKY